MRQEIFNQFIHSGMLDQEMVRSVALVYTAQRMTRDIQERRADITVVYDNLNFRVEEFIVTPEGDLAIPFYRTENSRLDNARLYFGDDLSLTMVNTWVPDMGDEAPKASEHRNERYDPRDRRAAREQRRGRPVYAKDHTEQIDIDILRQIYHKASGETMDLLRNFWKMVHPVKVARKHNVNDIVYSLGEPDRLEAMFEVRVVRPGAGDHDLDLVHLLTGEPRTTHSSNYGTEQDWLKSLIRRDGRREPELIPNDEERDFMDKAAAYVKANGKQR